MGEARVSTEKVEVNYVIFHRTSLAPDSYFLKRKIGSPGQMLLLCYQHVVPEPAPCAADRAWSRRS